MLKTIAKFRLKPTQVLAVGFAVTIIIGGLLLNLPIASATGKSVGLLPAMFTSTSAVCVTGLTVVLPSAAFSIFGKIVLLLLIQVGGLGFMTIATFLFTMTKRRISLQERLIIQNALNEDSLQGMVRFVKRICITTFLIEGLGAVLLALRFIPMVGVSRGIFYGIFHSVSAFCNAGFDIIGPNNLEPFVGDPLVSYTVMALVIVGGLGFAVLSDVFRNFKTRRFSLHTRVVLIVTAVLIFGGTLLFFIFESGNAGTIGNPNLPFGTKLMASAFQSVTTRTAGFSTVSQHALTTPAKVVTMLLMFIGASPASTGGGVKTSTFALAIVYVISVMRGKKEVDIGGRSVSHSTLDRAIAIIIISLALICFMILGISWAEQARMQANEVSFENVVFEVFSAFGTVGLSAGLTPKLCGISKVLLMITMFIGRLGPLTITFTIVSRAKEASAVSYPEGRIMVG